MSHIVWNRRLETILQISFVNMTLPNLCPGENYLSIQFRDDGKYTIRPTRRFSRHVLSSWPRIVIITILVQKLKHILPNLCHNLGIRVA
jgi:hypothetical protein